MTVLNRLMVVATCGLALALVTTVEPALAKDPAPYSAADAARKYCGRAFKRYCSKVPAEGLGVRLPQTECEAFAARLPQGSAGALRPGDRIDNEDVN